MRASHHGKGLAVDAGRVTVTGVSDRAAESRFAAHAAPASTQLTPILHLTRLARLVDRVQAGEAVAVLASVVGRRVFGLVDQDGFAAEHRIGVEVYACVRGGFGDVDDLEFEVTADLLAFDPIRIVCRLADDREDFAAVDDLAVHFAALAAGERTGRHAERE